MEYYQQIVNILENILGVIGILIIFTGSLKVFIFYLSYEIRENNESRNEKYFKIRLELGRYLILGLEFLIGKDILGTIIDPTWDSLGKLGAIIVIRTVLSYFLEREMKEIENLHIKMKS